MIKNLGKQAIGYFAVLIILSANAFAQTPAPAKEAAKPVRRPSHRLLRPQRQLKHRHPKPHPRCRQAALRAWAGTIPPSGRMSSKRRSTRRYLAAK